MNTLMTPNRWYDSINDLYRLLIMIGIFIIPFFMIGIISKDWTFASFVNNLFIGIAGLYRILYSMVV